MPIGAVAGMEETMSVYDGSAGKAACPQSGTFTANPLSMAAGVASMRMFTRDAIERLNALGESARTKLREAFRIADVEGQITGEGSLILFHMSDEPLDDYRAVYRAGTEGRARRLEALFRSLLNHGDHLVHGDGLPVDANGEGGDRPLRRRGAGESAHARARGRLSTRSPAP